MRKMKFLWWCVLSWFVGGMAGAVFATETTTYVLTDVQGTVLAREDAHGVTIAQYDYTPYGQVQTGPATAGPGYTGHVNDPDTGLVYMQARYYDPEMGRFPSVDPIGPTPGNVYNFNRYGYASNNPVINIDPDGRESACVSQKNHCSGENPAAKAAATSVLHYAYGALSAVANKWNGTFHAGTAEGGQIMPSNTAQAAGMLTGAIVADLAGSIATEGRSAEVSAAKAAEGFAGLAKFRSDLGLQAGEGTLARLEVGGQTFYGINAHGQPVTMNVNAITRTHAEADAFQQAFNAGARGESAVLHVDRALCTACGQNGGVRSMARQLGVNQTTVITPQGTQIIGP